MKHDKVAVTQPYKVNDKGNNLLLEWHEMRTLKSDHYSMMQLISETSDMVTVSLKIGTALTSKLTGFQGTTNTFFLDIGTFLY